MIDLHRSRTVSRACLAVLLGWAVSQAAFAQTVYPYPDELPDLYHFASLPPVSYPLPDGRKLVGAFTARGIGVTRVLADGSIDRSFGRAGLATLVAWGGGAYGVLPVLAVQQDGRILVAHTAKDNSHVAGCDYYYTDCNMHTVLHRLDAEGGLDLSFNGYGRLVLRIGGAPTQQHAEDSDEHFVRSITLGADGSALLGSFSGVMARVLPGGVLDRTTLYPAREHDFIAAVPFYHAGLDQFFVSADVGEIAGLDRQWSANDGWFHVYPAGWTATPTVPVCRFYGLPEAGLDSHLLTANADECAALEAAEGRTGWRLEGREVFRVELPDPDTGECAAGRAPVYRLWNARPDSGHVLTTAWYARRNLMAIGYISEGWGPLGVAMCSATW